ncbi:MAG: Fpg/Nei family DNA glycosylase [Motilibacteraceae bacterium]
MPEGHTIHRLARDLGARFAGDAVRASSPQGRFEEGAALVDGQVLQGTDAHGKHLFLGPVDTKAGERWVHVHLGLYGTFRFGHQPAPAVRGALRLRLDNDEHWADLRGPTACELVDPAQKSGLHARLGADPLRRDADPERAYARISRSRTAVGALLMQQEVVAGVGNVYRAEVLFRHGISPHRPGKGVDQATWDAVWEDLRGLLRAGVKAGRIVTTLPADRPEGRRRSPRREDSFYVYKRTGLPCRRCGTAVLSEPFVGRTLYWCPACQPA